MLEPREKVNHLLSFPLPFGSRLVTWALCLTDEFLFSGTARKGAKESVLVRILAKVLSQGDPRIKWPKENTHLGLPHSMVLRREVPIGGQLYSPRTLATGLL